MMYMRKNTIRYRRGNGRRGSVIVLVVAVLALLAVIGTVYIVSARSERSAATADAVAENLDNAQRAVNDTIATGIGGAIYDGNGYLGGSSTLGLYGDRAARRHDIPEVNIFNSGYSSYNGGPDESWLVSNLYRPYVMGAVDPRYSDMSMPAARTPVKDTVTGTIYYSPSVFDPNTGAYDIPVFTYANGVPSLSPVFVDNAGGNTSGLFRVVASVLPTGLADTSGGTFSARDDGLVQLLPFSEANGVRYRYGVRILDTSRMANLNVGMPGMPYNGAGPLQPWETNGTYLTGYNLASPSVFNSAAVFAGAADVPANLQVAGSLGPNNRGRQGMWNMPGILQAEYAWLYGVSRFETMAAPLTCPYDLADELELRSYGNVGTIASLRPATSGIWTNTLGNRPLNSQQVQYNQHRGFYTAYSWSRDLRPYRDPVTPVGISTAYQLWPWPLGKAWFAPPPSGNNSTLIWPPYPARIGANPETSTYAGIANPQQAADALAIAATNIATAMNQVIPGAKYTTDEARAFVANYLTYRWNSWAPTGTKSLSGNNYYTYRLTAGPSFVDNIGPCLRTGVVMGNNGNYASDLKSGDPKKVFIGYAAQPFINEAAAHYTWQPPVGPAPGKWIEDDGAVELYNPYDVALSLDDFKLNIKGTDVDFTGKDEWIPPHGYFVLTEVKNQLDTTPTKIPNTAVKDDAATKSLTLKFKDGTKAYLMRKYWDRNGNQQWAAVDQYDLTGINGSDLDPNGAGSPVTHFEARPNLNDGTERRWVATLHDATVAEAAKPTNAGLTLGKDNAAPATTPTNFIPLYDRTLELYPAISGGSPPLADYQHQILANVADFARIMRVTNQIDPNTGPVKGLAVGGGAGGLSVQLNTLSAAASGDTNVGKSLNPADAMVHFDFLASPNLYSSVPTNPNPALYKQGDTRAVNLLECLAFTDRLSDYTINLGDNNASDRGLSKIRIPGQINVNTASAEVLGTIPILASYPQLIGYILAYRWRTSTIDTRIPLAFRANGANGFDFRSPNDFPGYGVRSLAELEVPIYIARSKGVATPLAANTLKDRDLFWGTMYNMLTVRSDTFVVYAYLEAVRQNPRYTGGFNNDTVWYLTSTGVGGAVTDDPTDALHPLLRVSRKRWVALVDRSQNNFSRATPDPVIAGKFNLDSRFAQPRVVAARDLPQ